jgi:hypothetical protein
MSNSLGSRRIHCRCQKLPSGNFRGGWLQVYQLPERAGHGSCTLPVSSIAEIIASVENFGIDTSQRTSGEKVKTLMISDPDGNHIAFAETIDKSMAK